MKSDLSVIQDQLREMLRQAEALDLELQRCHIQRSDDETMVTADANGHGALIDVQISETAFQYPNRLGGWTTSAIRHACRAGNLLGRRLCEVRYPDLLPASTLEAFMSTEPVDMLAIDHAGSPRERDATSRYMERLRDLAVAAEGFRRRGFRCGVGSRAGWVVANIAGDVLKVTIDPETPRHTTRQRLAAQIVAAVGKARAHADQVRQEEIDERVKGA
jgi:DNA-binding protein YbaB